MRDKYIAIAVLILAAVLAHWVYVDVVRPRAPVAPGALDTYWFAANTRADSFTVSTAGELAGLAAIVNGTWGGKPEAYGFKGKTVTLAADIDLSAYPNWAPIGSELSIPDHYSGFSGTFDGRGHIVRSLTVNRPATNHQGLFGLINAAEVMNIGLENANVTGSEGVGGIAGSMDKNSSISNCYSTGTISGRRAVGGVAGAVGHSTVSHSYSLAEVRGGDRAGGIAGQMYESKVSNCYSAGKVGGAHEAGGIAGAVTTGSVINCAALNPRVMGRDKITTGRVAGYISDKLRATAIDSLGESILANNAACDMMVINAATADTSLNRKGAYRIDGADISAYEINTAGTFRGRFMGVDGWTASPGYLPGLFGKTVPMPGHLLFAAVERHNTLKKVQIKRIIIGVTGRTGMGYPESEYTVGEKPVWAHSITEYDHAGHLAAHTASNYPDGPVEHSIKELMADISVLEDNTLGISVRNWRFLDDNRITDRVDTLNVEPGENGHGERVLVHREEDNRVRIFELAVDD
ncbi:MAG: hypothetical protein FWB85_08650 [Chitinispirillia bacterium]|nr:hypothetical protein [Chitinispirillia bacterium]MCL2242317.1 hypothetical protein [Chitinispirillia bacterium]